MTTSLLEQLIDALRVLPGVGQKSAQRMAYHLLERQRDGGRPWPMRWPRRWNTSAIASVAAISAKPRCARPAPATRATMHLLCAVESPADRLAIEQATGYRGLYFVLQGRLSRSTASARANWGWTGWRSGWRKGEVQELIVATNPTVEGEATAHYLAQLARRGVHPSRLAHGVPLGGELEYVDRGTLSHAFGSRSEIPDERSNGERAHGEHN
jgi:recombination protein RecR